MSQRAIACLYSRLCFLKKLRLHFLTKYFPQKTNYSVNVNELFERGQCNFIKHKFHMVTKEQNEPAGVNLLTCVVLIEASERQANILNWL